MASNDPWGTFALQDSGDEYHANSELPHATNMAGLVKDNWGTLATIGILSALARANGRNSAGQVIGGAGLDALGALGGMGVFAQKHDQQVAKRREDQRQRDIANDLAERNYALDEKYKMGLLDVNRMEAQTKAQKEALAAAKLAQQMEMQRSYEREVLGEGGGYYPSYGQQPVSGGVGAGGGAKPGTIAYDFNNPLNLKVAGRTEDPDRRAQFRRFNSTDEAWPVYAEQIRRYGNGLPAIDILRKWEGNPNLEYLNTVARVSGLDLSKPITNNNEMARLMAGMSMGEGGGSHNPAHIEAILSGGMAPRPQTAGVPTSAYGAADPAQQQTTPVQPSQPYQRRQSYGGDIQGEIDALNDRIARASNFFERNKGAFDENMRNNEAKNIELMKQRRDALIARRESDVNMAENLLTKFNTNEVVKQYNNMGAAFSQLVNTAEVSFKTKTGAADVALLTSFAKILDPGSVVRPSEFEAAARSGGFGEKVKMIYDHFATGKLLTDDQKRDIVEIAMGRAEALRENFDAVSSMYVDRFAAPRGIDPTLLGDPFASTFDRGRKLVGNMPTSSTSMPGMGAAQPQPQQTPKVDLSGMTSKDLIEALKARR